MNAIIYINVNILQINPNSFKGEIKFTQQINNQNYCLAT